jgi:hypothetical protein
MLRRSINELKYAVVRKIHQSDEKQDDQFQYLHEKMSDYHRSTILWVVGTAIGTGSLIVALIKLL